VERLVTTDPASAVSVAPPGAFHLVMTYSHPLDLGICHAVLGRGDAGYVGLIGSATKRARFVKRLADLGHRPEMVAERLHCPIGLPDLPGKAPAVIAVSVAADLVRRLARREASLAHARSGEA
jgi:xanthine dehydrogenase accessory factor